MCKFNSPKQKRKKKRKEGDRGGGGREGIEGERTEEREGEVKGMKEGGIKEVFPILP